MIQLQHSSPVLGTHMLMMSINTMSGLFFLSLTKGSWCKHCWQKEPDRADVLIVVGHKSRYSEEIQQMKLGDVYYGISFPKAICSKTFFHRKEVSEENYSPFLRDLLQENCTSSKHQVKKYCVIQYLAPFTPVYAIPSLDGLLTLMPRTQEIKV